MLLAALDQAGSDGKASGAIFIDDFTSTDSLTAGKYLSVVFTVANAKLRANVTHAADAEALLGSSAEAKAMPNIHAVDSVEVWGVTTAVSSVSVISAFRL